MNVKNAFFAKVFIRELDRWKEENNSSQEDFADRIGVHPNMISRYKKGTKHPTEKRLNSICQVLNVEKSIFFPHTFEDWFSSSEEFRRGVFADQESRECTALREAGVDLLFWEYLWRKIPYTKMVMPLHESDRDEDLIFLKKFPDDLYKVYRQDIEFVRHLQDDVAEYIAMQLTKKALQQRLEGRSDTRVVQVLFEMAKDLICHSENATDTKKTVENPTENT